MGVGGCRGVGGWLSRWGWGCRVGGCWWGIGGWVGGVVGMVSFWLELSTFFIGVQKINATAEWLRILLGEIIINVESHILVGVSEYQHFLRSLIARLKNIESVNSSDEYAPIPISYEITSLLLCLVSWQQVTSPRNGRTGYIIKDITNNLFC